MSAVQQIICYIGVAYAAVGLGVLLNPEYYKKLLEEEYPENRPVVYLNGYIILFVTGVMNVLNGKQEPLPVIWKSAEIFKF